MSGPAATSNQTPAVNPCLNCLNKVAVGDYQRPGFFEVFYKYLSEASGLKNVAKLISYSEFWASNAVSYLKKADLIDIQIPAVYGTFSRHCSAFKSAISATEFPEKIGTFCASTVKFWSERTFASITTLTKDGAFLTNALHDALDLAKDYIEVGTEYLKTASQVNFVATVVASSISSIEDFAAIVKSKVWTSEYNQMSKPDGAREAQTLTLNLLNEARNVSYLALGCIGVAATIMEAVVAPWMFVLTLTSGTAFSVAGYFYKNMVDPENKNDPVQKAMPLLRDRMNAVTV